MSGERELPQGTEYPNNNFSRRDFLKRGLGIGAVVFESKTPNFTRIENLAFNAELFSDTGFGFSFSPERLSWFFTGGKTELSLANYETPEGQQMLSRALSSLDYSHTNLGLNTIRLGIRWDNIVDENGNFNFGMYKPFFDYCINNGIDITLNFGIKVFGWPEEHIPPMFKQDASPEADKVSSQSDIAKAYMPWADKLFNYLTNIYTPEQLAKIMTVQPENEPFNPFGENKFTMDYDYLTELVLLAQKYFPTSRVLINSSELNNIGDIYSLFQGLSNFVDNDRLILGINYYPFIPGNLIDPIDLYNLESVFNKQAQLADFERQGYGIIVSELGIEPWSANNPPVGLRNTEMALINSENKILAFSQKPEIYFWGIQFLDTAGSDVSLPIFDLLRNLKNSKKSSVT